MKCGDFPHLLVYGPSGSGKKTRIMCLLRELYGPGVSKLRIEHQNFTTPSKKKLEISTIASNYHIEVNPRSVAINTKIFIWPGLIFSDYFWLYVAYSVTYKPIKKGKAAAVWKCINYIFKETEESRILDESHCYLYIFSISETYVIIAFVLVFRP